MPALTTYAANKLNDQLRGLTLFALPTVYLALIRATAGQSPRSTAVTVNQTTYPATQNGHMYRCTTAGTTSATEPTWPVGNAATVTDGTAVWTEMTPDFQAANTYTLGNEATYTGYARTATAGTLSASAAGTGVNSSVINCPTCTGGSNAIGAFMTFDGATVGAGNGLEFGSLALQISVNIAPSFAAGSFSTTMS